jgi:predicted acyl esterase
LRKFAFAVAALALAAPVLAENHIQPAVQPGGDIPRSFHPAFALPNPAGGDIPKSFTAPRAGFQYVRRELMIPMRDGAKLFTVLIIPRTAGKFPIMLDRTPYSAAPM